MQNSPTVFKITKDLCFVMKYSLQLPWMSRLWYGKTRVLRLNLKTWCAHRSQFMRKIIKNDLFQACVYTPRKLVSNSYTVSYCSWAVCAFLEVNEIVSHRIRSLSTFIYSFLFVSGCLILQLLLCSIALFITLQWMLWKKKCVTEKIRKLNFCIYEILIYSKDK